MIGIVVILVLMAFMALLAWCVIASASPDENERIREDMEQMEYLRKWREENDSRRKD